jgi:hypothetical protein
MKHDTKVVAELYLHVGNSGVNFSVRDRGYGPEVAVRTSAFGNLIHEFAVMTDKKSLRALGEMLVKASGADFTQEYVHKARPVDAMGPGDAGLREPPMKEVGSGT